MLRPARYFLPLFGLRLARERVACFNPPAVYLAFGLTIGTLYTAKYLLQTECLDGARRDREREAGRLEATSHHGMQIERVSPREGNKSDFPIRIIGRGFAPAEHLELTLAAVPAKILEVDPYGTSILVGFPDLPTGGFRSIAIQTRNKKTGESVQRRHGFKYVENSAI